MKHDEICEILKEIMPTEDAKYNYIENLSLFRADRSSHRKPSNYSQGIIIMLQGTKRVYLEENVITYDTNNYLVVSVPLPTECDVIATPENPVLCMHIDINSQLINEIMLSTDITDNQAVLQKGIYSDTINDNIEDAIYRLVKTFSSASDRKFLAPMYIKEIIYRVLINKNGYILRMLQYRNQKFYKISKVLEKIHQRYEIKYNIDDLAKEVNMSVSAFHSAFKTITDTSPLQYIKKIKLHKARELILLNGFNVSTVAYQVGYESVSQFTREYKRMFGVTPKQEI